MRTWYRVRSTYVPCGREKRTAAPSSLIGGFLLGIFSGTCRYTSAGMLCRLRTIQRIRMSLLISKCSLKDKFKKSPLRKWALFGDPDRKRAIQERAPRSSIWHKKCTTCGLDDGWSKHTKYVDGPLCANIFPCTTDASKVEHSASFVTSVSRGYWRPEPRTSAHSKQDATFQNSRRQ